MRYHGYKKFNFVIIPNTYPKGWVLTILDSLIHRLLKLFRKIARNVPKATKVNKAILISWLKIMTTRRFKKELKWMFCPKYLFDLRILGWNGWSLGEYIRRLFKTMWFVDSEKGITWYFSSMILLCHSAIMFMSSCLVEIHGRFNH